MDFAFLPRDPNTPTQLPVQWPEFTPETGQFLQLKTGDTKVINTPNKERNERVIKDLFSARRRQIPLDIPRKCDSETYPTC